MLYLKKEGELMETLIFSKDKSSIDIMEELCQKCFYPEQFKTLEEYLIWSSQSLWRFNAIGIQIPNGSLECKCDSFVEQLTEHGFIERSD
jgi:hypothetical protein